MWSQKPCVSVCYGNDAVSEERKTNDTLLKINPRERERERECKERRGKASGSAAMAFLTKLASELRR